MEKRKQQDERKETGGRQKGGYKRNAKERASGNIQTQNRVYEGHPRPQDGRGQQSTVPLLQYISIRRPHTVRMQRRPENEHGHEKGSMEKIIDYNKILEWKKQPKSIKDHSKEEEDQSRWR
jgi:hypothetical protein